MKVVLTLSFCLLSLILAACAPMLERQNPHQGENNPVLAVSPVTTKEPFHPAKTTLPILPSPTDGDDPGTTPPEMVDLDQLDIPYTSDNPLTDADEILKILDTLAQRHIEWLSRPGWYVYRRSWEVGEYHLWGTHFTNGQGDCREQFHLLEKGGELYPVEIWLVDGTWGRLYGVKGRLDQAAVIPSNDKTPCQMEDAYHVSTVIQMAPDIQRRLESAKTGEIEAYELLLWQEVIDGRKVVVLFEEMRKTEGMFRLADGTFVLVDREIHWTYLDPETGGIVGGDMVMYAENGEILGGEEKGNREVMLADLIFYDELPPELAQVYEESAAALREFIEKQGQ